MGQEIQPVLFVVANAGLVGLKENVENGLTMGNFPINNSHCIVMTLWSHINTASLRNNPMMLYHAILHKLPKNVILSYLISFQMTRTTVQDIILWLK